MFGNGKQLPTVTYDLLHYTSINQNQTQYCYNYYFQTMQRYFIIENQRDLKTGLSKKKKNQVINNNYNNQLNNIKLMITNRIQHNDCI